MHIVRFIPSDLAEGTGPSGRTQNWTLTAAFATASHKRTIKAQPKTVLLHDM